MDTGRVNDPIFVLGVGRCGSTYQQARLSQLANVWIWGEHDGILGPLLAWGDRVRGSDKLQRFSFDQPDADPDLVKNAGRGNATALAWINGFRPPDIAGIQQSAINELMTRGLPTGKTRWGFKEIRYGPHDRVPEKLLALFPEGKLVHTLRNPVHTIESCVFSWGFARVKAAVEAKDEKTLDRMYEKHATKWNEMTAYFLDLEADNPGRVITSRIESFEADLDRLLQFLRIDDCSARPAGSGEAVNASLRSSTKRGANKLAEKIAERRSRFAGLIAETAHRAGYDLEI